MNSPIPEDLREFVEAKAKERGYSSASEYVGALIRSARDRAAKESELRELVNLGLESLGRGDAIELDEATLSKFFDEVKARARQRLSGSKRQGG